MAYKVSSIVKRLGYGDDEDEYRNEYDNGTVWDSPPDNSSNNQNIYGEKTSSIIQRLGYTSNATEDPLSAERNVVTSYSNKLNELGVEAKKPSIFSKILGGGLKALEIVTAVPNSISNAVSGTIGSFNKYGERSDEEFFNSNSYKELESKGYDVRIGSSNLGGGSVNSLVNKSTGELIKNKDLTDEQRTMLESANQDYKVANSNNQIGLKETAESIVDGLKSGAGTIKGAFTNDYDGVVDFATVNRRNRESANANNRDDASKLSAPGRVLAKAVTLGKVSDETAEVWGDIVADIGTSIVLGGVTDVDGASKMLKYLNKTDELAKIDKFADVSEALKLAKKTNPLEAFKKQFDGQGLSPLKLETMWAKETKAYASELSNSVKKQLGGLTDANKVGWKAFGNEITTESLDKLKTSTLKTNLTKVGLSLYSPVGALTSSNLGSAIKKIPGIDRVDEAITKGFTGGKFGEQAVNMKQKPENALKYANQVLSQGLNKEVAKIRLSELRNKIGTYINSEDKIDPTKVTTAIEDTKDVVEETIRKTDVPNPKYNETLETMANKRVNADIDVKTTKISELKAKIDELEATPVTKEVEEVSETVSKPELIKPLETPVVENKAKLSGRIVDGDKKPLNELYEDINNKELPQSPQITKELEVKKKRAKELDNQRSQTVSEFERLGVKLTDEQKLEMGNLTSEDLAKYKNILTGKENFAKQSKEFIKNTTGSEDSLEDTLEMIMEARRKGTDIGEIKYNDVYKENKLKYGEAFDDPRRIPSSRQFEYSTFDSIEDVKARGGTTKAPIEKVDKAVKSYMLDKNHYKTVSDSFKKNIQDMIEDSPNGAEKIVSYENVNKMIREIEKETGIKYSPEIKKVLKERLQSGEDLTYKGNRELLLQPIEADNYHKLSQLNEDELDMLKSAMSNKKAPPSMDKTSKSVKKIKPQLETEEALKTNMDNYIDNINSNSIPDDSFDAKANKEYMGTQAEFDIYADNVKIGKPAVDGAIKKLKQADKYDSKLLATNLKIDDIKAYLKDYTYEGNNFKNTKAIISKEQLDKVIGDEKAVRDMFEQVVENENGLASKSLNAKLKYILGDDMPDVPSTLPSLDKLEGDSALVEKYTKEIFNTVNQENLSKIASERLKSIFVKSFGDDNSTKILNEPKLQEYINKTLDIKVKDADIGMKEYFPKIYEALNDELIGEDFRKLLGNRRITNINKYISEASTSDFKSIKSLVETNISTKIVDDLEGLEIRNKNISELNTNLNEIKKEVDVLIRKKDTFSTSELVDDYIKNNPDKVEYLKSKIPMYNSIEEKFKTVYESGTKKYLNESEVKLFDDFKKDMEFVAEREGITGDGAKLISNYVTHMVRPELVGEKDLIELAKKVGLIADDLNLNEPFNVHNLTRKLKGTVDEINRDSSKKLGISLFEDNIYRLWYGRMASSEKYMYKKGMFDNVMNSGLGYEFVTRDKFKASSEFKNYGEYIKAMKKKAKDEELIMVKVKEADYTKPTKVVDSMVDDLTKQTKMYETGDMLIEDFAEDLNTGSFLVDKRAWEHYQKELANTVTKDKNVFLDVYDKFNGLFKKQAVFTPRFLINNGIGNTFSSYMTSGVNISNPIYKKKARQIMKGEDIKIGDYSSEQIRRYMSNNGALSTQLESELNIKDFMKGDVNELSKIDGKQTPLEKLGKAIDTPFDYLYKKSNKMEQEAKVINFITHLDNGMNLSDALELTNKALFDYDDLTKFEKDVMKRIIPFYTYMRKNIPLQYELLGDKTAKYGRIEKGYRDASKGNETDQERALRPDYMKENLALGDGKYLGLALPIFDLGKALDPVGTLLTSSSPLLKTPLELAVNKQFNSGYDISRNDKASEKIKYALESTNPLIALTNKLVGGLSPDEDKKKVARNAAKSALGVGMVKDFDLEKAQKTSLDDYAVELQNQYYEYLDDNPLIKQALEEEKKNQKAKGKISPIMKALGY